MVVLLPGKRPGECQAGPGPDMVTSAWAYDPKSGILKESGEPLLWGTFILTTDAPTGLLTALRLRCRFRSDREQFSLVIRRIVNAVDTMIQRRSVSIAELVHNHTTGWQSHKWANLTVGNEVHMADVQRETRNGYANFSMQWIDFFQTPVC